MLLRHLQPTAYCRSHRSIWVGCLLAVLYLVLCTLYPACARPTSQTNIAKNLVVGGSFQNAMNITDGSVHTYAVVNNALESDNYIEIDLQSRLYLRQVKIYFEDGAFPTSFAIDAKVDAFSGTTLKDKILTATYPREGGNRVVVINVDNVAAKSLRFNFTKGMARDKTIRIGEVEVYANMDEWPEAKADIPSIITDTEAFLTLRSNVEFTGSIVVEELTGDTAQVVQKVPTGVYTREHAIFVHGLLPGRRYRYRMDFTDFHGNMSYSVPVAFSTRSSNLLLRRSVEGTFTAFQPDDPNYVKPEGNPLSRVNDGDDNYFSSMVTSREPDAEDQYLVFDLGKVTPLNTLFIYWRALAYSRAYEIDISNDAEQWTTVVRGADADQGVRSYSSRGDPMLVARHDLKGVKAQYVRILHKKNAPYIVRDPSWKFIQIMEVKLF